MKKKLFFSLLFFGLGFSLYASEYFSETEQDEFVNEHIFKNKKNGFFIDIGAHEGIKNSNTYFFEKNLEWNGICFEPNPPSFNILIENRRCLCINACISNFSGKKLFVSHPCSWVSGLLDKYNPEHYNKWGISNHLDKLIEVQCYLLNDILKKDNIKYIDLLSIDTEGGELEILQSIDFDYFEIDVIVVENIYRDSKYQEFLSSKGYNLVTRKSRDEIYKKQKRNY